MQTSSTSGSGCRSRRRRCCCRRRCCRRRRRRRWRRRRWRRRRWRSRSRSGRLLHLAHLVPCPVSSQGARGRSLQVGRHFLLVFFYLRIYFFKKRSSVFPALFHRRLWWRSGWRSRSLSRGRRRRRRRRRRPGRWREATAPRPRTANSDLRSSSPSSLCCHGGPFSAEEFCHNNSFFRLVCLSV